MQDTLSALTRAISARLGCIIVKTSDEESLSDAIKETLLAIGHRVTVWSAILGLAETEMDNDTSSLKFKDEWDESSRADPMSVLTQWIEVLQQGEDNISFCPKCKTWSKSDSKDPAKHKAAAAAVCKGLGCEGGDWGPSHRTLVVRGAAHWVAPEANTYEPLVTRAMWDIAQYNHGPQYTNLVVVLPPDTNVPDFLVQNGTVIEDALPTRDEIIDFTWYSFMEGIKEKPHRMIAFAGVDTDSPEVKSQVADRLSGLSRPEINGALKTAIIMGSEAAAEGKNGYEVFLKKLGDTKAAGLKKSAALELVAPVPLTELGGVDNLRQWLLVRQKAFSADALAHGIPRPRGIILAGPPGSGKSTAAKVSASVLGFPLVTLDFGALFQGLVGSSEANIRNALRTVDAASPCVLMVDEMDKALSGTGGESTDGGTSQRVLGTFLSWLQERDNNAHPVFCVATMNSVHHLPPEVLRRGRFDDLWFVDLPSPPERRQILEIHMGKANTAAGNDECKLYDGDWEGVLKVSNQFVGAELAQAVTDARLQAYFDGKPFDVHYLTAALRDTKPIALTMSEKIEAVRDWAKHRARRASPEYVAPAPPVFTPTDMPKKSTFGGFGNVS